MPSIYDSERPTWPSGDRADKTSAGPIWKSGTSLREAGFGRSDVLTEEILREAIQKMRPRPVSASERMGGADRVARE